ncbi:MAG: glycosyltransferase family 1 protein [Ilumatobacter sp.]|nr:MAG: glycosyltransferase family 1 protein [Ilumatobacter sp.]
MSTGARPRILYLLTDELSRLLVRGQLGFLQGEGFEVTVASRWAAPDQPADGWDEGVDLRHLPFRREPAVLDDLRALRATVALIREVRPDIVNASTPKAGLIGMMAAWLCRVPVRVYVVRGLRVETARGLKRALLWSLERVALACASRVIFNSRSLLRTAERQRLIRPGRGEVLGAGSGNGIDVTRFDENTVSTAEARIELGLAPDIPVIGFVGRLTNDKGVADLVHAFNMVLETGLDLQLLLVGGFEQGDPLSNDVRAEIESHPRICHVGWLADPTAAYRAMDLLAFPSYREGLPNVPIEAQLCGVPVVGYAATGTVDAVKHPQGLVPVGHVAGLAGKIRCCLEGKHPAADELRDWVIEKFDRTRVWNELASNYRQWLDSTGKTRLSAARSKTKS